MTGGRRHRSIPGNLCQAASYARRVLAAFASCRPAPAAWAVPGVTPAALLRRNVNQTLLIHRPLSGCGARGVAPQ